MRNVRCSWLSHFIFSLFTVSLFMVQASFSQKLNIPYPIIFIHGINSDNNTWGNEDGKFDNVIDNLDAAGLKSGGHLNICLSYARSPDNFDTKKEDDVHLFNTPGSADFYTINFNIHASGRLPIVYYNPDKSVIYPHLTGEYGLDAMTITFNVSSTDEFLPGDIISMDNEFMQVTGVDANNKSLTVNRGRCQSQAAPHNPVSRLLNISNESNQASIVKQGYGLMLAIKQVKLATGANKVILVGHSMGGLAAREYIRTYHNHDVAELLTIGTPHYGADITKLPDFLLDFPGVDGSSDAARDLRASFNSLSLDGIKNLTGTIPGIYLFGGNESVITGFYDEDIDGDGSENSQIIGLNTDYSSLSDVKCTYIVSYLNGIFGDRTSDGVVSVNSQYIFSGDTLRTTGFHTDEPKDAYSLIRGLDEPDEPEFALEINKNSNIKGFITYKINRKSTDIDYYKINFSANGLVKIKLSGNHTGATEVDLLDNNLHPVAMTLDTSKSFSSQVTPNAYYIKVTGTASDDFPTYLNPYALSVTTTDIPLATFTSLPDAAIGYYDVVANQSRDTTITLTNSSTAELKVTGLTLTGINQDQFSVTSPLNFAIAPGKTQNITLRFKPTSTGKQTAVLNIANNSTDAPVKTIALSGNGTDHPTKTLTVLPDAGYNFGNKTITETVAELFTVTNTGSNALTVTDITLTGTNTGDFNISKPAVPINVTSNGGSSIFVVNFKPSSVGSKTAKLIIANNSDKKSPGDTITLYGNGTNSIYTGITGKIAAYEYWFDDSYSSKVSTSINTQNISYLTTGFPTPGLTTGSHMLHLRYKDQKGQWSSVVTQNFYKQPVGPTGHRMIIAYEYWFDNNYNAKIFVNITASSSFNLNDSLQMDALSKGAHSMHLRYKDDIGQWSTIITNNFYKGNKGNNLMTTYRYWFDSDYKDINTVSQPKPANPSTIPSSLTTGNLKEGNHKIYLQFRDNHNAWSVVAVDSFYYHKCSILVPIITAKCQLLISSSKIGNQWFLNGVPISGANSQEYNATENGNYTVLVSDTSGCSSTSLTTALMIYPLVNASINPSGSVSQLASSPTILTANSGMGYTYQWSKDGVDLPNQINPTYQAIISGSYRVKITANGCESISDPTIVNSTFTLPPTNFKLTITSATCKGSSDGSVNITAVQSLAYTATITGNGVNTPYPFTTSTAISNLAAGSYQVCITVSGQPDYSQCYDVVITEPKDLSVYSVINIDNSLTLGLSGGALYNIVLNGAVYTTSNNSITLPLGEGTNDLSVTTDRLCQGSFKRLINISGRITPYPVPFQNTLSLNVGNTPVGTVGIEIHNVSDGKLVYTKQYVNQSGVIQLDLSNLKDGVYALHLSLDSSDKIFKIVKK